MLFKPEDAKGGELQGSAVKGPALLARFVSEGMQRDLMEAFGALEMGTEIHYDTVNKWSLHDIVVHCLAYTGPADLYIATWSIKEYPARVLVNLKEQGLVRDLYAMFDHRIQTTSPEAYQLIEANATQVGLLRCHAKLAVLVNDTWGVAVASSANFTTNTRAEVGVITCTKEAADFRRNWILKNIAR
jgi:hypothetical protein